MVFRAPPPSQSTSAARAHHASLHPWPPRCMLAMGWRALPLGAAPEQPRGAAHWECPAPLAFTRPGSGLDGVGTLRSRPPGRPSHTHQPPHHTPPSPTATQLHASHVPRVKSKAHATDRGSRAEQRLARPARLSLPSPPPIAAAVKTLNTGARRPHPARRPAPAASRRARPALPWACQSPRGGPT